MRPLKLSIAILLALSGLLSITPTAQAQAGTLETFDDDTVGQNPSAPWYAYTEVGSGTQTVGVVSNQASSAPNSLMINSHSTSQTLFKNPIFTVADSYKPTPGLDMCSSTTAQASFTVSFRFRVSAITSAGVYFGFIGNHEVMGSNHGAGFYIDGSGAAVARVAASGGSHVVAVPDLVIAPNTFYPVEISGVSCTATEHVSIYFPDQGAGTEAGPATGTVTSVNGFGIMPAATGIAPDVWIDDFELEGNSLSTGLRFCANPDEHDSAGNADSANPNYGYTYRRGGGHFDQSEDDEPGIGLSTGYAYSGTSSESSWDYSAKQFTVGSEAMHAVVKIEAAEDFGASSVFRVSFNTVSGAQPSATTKGNGLDTQNFANHAEAQFTENGDKWQIALFYVTGGGTRTQLGPAVNHGSANDARTYSVWSDNTGSDPWIAVKDSAGATVATSNSTAPGTLATFQTAFAGDEIYDIWYIGYGTGILDATTALDNQETASNTDSTCMYDDTGTAVTHGSVGLQDSSSVPPPIDESPEEADDCLAVFCPPTEGIGGLSSSSLSLFLGIVIVASFAASMSQGTGTGAAGLAIFALLGVFIAYALGYVELWVVLVLFTIGLGAIFLGFHNGGKSEGM